MLARYRVNRAGVVRMPPGDPGVSASRPHGVRPTPTMRTRTFGPSGGPVDPSYPWLACCTLASSRVSVSPTCLPEVAANLGVTMTSSARRGLNSRPASMTGRSMVRVIWSSASGNPVLAAGVALGLEPEHDRELGQRGDFGQGRDLGPVEPWLVGQHRGGRGQRAGPEPAERALAAAGTRDGGQDGRGGQGDEQGQDRQRPPAPEPVQAQPGQRDQHLRLPPRPTAANPRRPCSRVEGLLRGRRKGAGTTG